MADFQVVAKLMANVSDFKSGMEQASSSLREFQKQTGSNMQKVGETMSNVGAGMTAGLTLPLAAIGGHAFKMAAEVQDAMGASDQIFKGSSATVKKWAKEMPTYYGYAEGEALSYANTMGAMLQNIGGLTEEHASKTSGELVQLAGDLSAMFGGSSQSAVQALTNALKGNYSMLDNYGMGISATTVNQKALEMGLADTTSELTLQDKQAAALALIMEQTADAQGQAARESEGASGAMRSFTAAISRLQEAIGQHLLPIFAPIINKITDWIAKFGKLDSKTQETIVKFGLFIAAIGPLLMIIGNLVIWISKVGTAFKTLAGVGKLITGAFGLVKTAVMGLISVIGGLSAPILAVIAVVAALVAGFVYLWNTNENFRNGVIAIWDNIKSAVSSAVEAIGQWLQKIGDWLGELMQLLANGDWSGAWNMIKEAAVNMWNALMSFISSTWESIKTMVSNGMNALPGIISSVGSFISSTWNIIWEGIRSFFSTIWEGIKGIVTAGINALPSIISGIGGLIRSAWELIWTGVKTVVTFAWSTIKSLITVAINAIPGIISGAAAIISQAWNDIWEGIKQFANDVWELIKEAVQSGIDGIAPIITGAWESIRSTWENAWNGLKDFIGTFFEEVLGKIGEWIANIGETIAPVTEFFGNTFNGAKEVVGGAIDGAKNFVNNGVNYFAEKFSWGQQEVSTQAQVMASNVETAAANVPNSASHYETFANNSASAVNGMQGSIPGVLASITGSANSEGAAIEATKAYYDNLSRLSISATTSMNLSIGATYGLLRARITSESQSMETAMKTAFNNIRQNTMSAMNGVNSTVTAGMARVVTSIKSSMTNAVSAMNNAAGQAQSAGANMGRGFYNGLASMQGSIISLARSIANAAASAMRSALRIKSPSRVTRAIGNFTGEGFVNGIKSMVKPAEKMATKLGLAGVPTINPSDITGELNRLTTGQLNTGYTFNGGSLTVQQQPAYIHLNMGNSEFRTFSRDIKHQQQLDLVLEGY